MPILSPLTASAATALPLNTPTSFDFDGVGSHAIGAPFTFTSASSVALHVVDGYLIGDRFTVSDNGTTLGSTSVPVGSGTDGSSYTAALTDPKMSKGCWVLAPGSHSVDIVTLASPFGGGGAWIDATTDLTGCGVPIDQLLAALPGSTTNQQLLNMMTLIVNAAKTAPTQALRDNYLNWFLYVVHSPASAPSLSPATITSLDGLAHAAM